MLQGTGSYNAGDAGGGRYCCIAGAFRPTKIKVRYGVGQSAVASAVEPHLKFESL